MRISNHLFIFPRDLMTAKTTFCNSERYWPEQKDIFVSPRESLRPFLLLVWILRPYFWSQAILALAAFISSRKDLTILTISGRLVVALGRRSCQGHLWAVAKESGPIEG